MTSSEAQALAALATHGAGLLVSGLPNDQQGRLHLTPVPPGQQPMQAANTRRLRVEWAGGQLALDLSPQVIDQWVGMTLGIDDLAALPEAFAQAAIHHVVDWITLSLAGTGRGQAQLTAMESAGQARPSDAPHAIALRLDLGTQELHCLLHLDSLALMLVGSLAKELAPSDDEQALDDLPVYLDLCIGQTLVPMTQFQQLRSGGLIFLAESYLGEGQSLMLRTELGPRQRWSAPALVDGLSLQILAKPITMNTQVPTPTDSEDDAPSWENMPVHLSFDLGQKVLTLAQLQQISEGQALPLDKPVDSGVTIRANGAVIGQGQMVDIDGRLGVLVSTLHSPKKTATE